MYVFHTVQFGLVWFGFWYILALLWFDISPLCFPWFLGWNFWYFRILLPTAYNSSIHCLCSMSPSLQRKQQMQLYYTQFNLMSLLSSQKLKMESKSPNFILQNLLVSMAKTFNRSITFNRTSSYLRFNLFESTVPISHRTNRTMKQPLQKISFIFVALSFYTWPNDDDDASKNIWIRFFKRSW